MSDLVPATPHLATAAPMGVRLAPMRQILSQPAVQRAYPAIGAISALVLVASAWYAFQSPTQRPVFEGLADADKGAVADALQSAGIAHAVDRSTGSVTVGEDDFYKARMLLASQGLPKAAPAGDALIGALPMGASRAIEGETLKSAREADLARTIEAIDSVKSARIHLATPEPSPFLRDQSAPAASVMLTLQPGRTLGEAKVRAIGHLVASSVPGLSADQVSIVDQSGALLSQPETGDSRGLEMQTQIEDRARRALASMLAPMVGAENYTAEIHADLDLSESQSTRESYPKDDRALRREEGNKTSGSTSTAPAIGIPGALSNQPPLATQVSAAPGGTVTSPAQTPAAPAASGSSDETYVRAFDVGREISVTRQPTGRLRRLTVAVALRDIKGAKGRTPQDIATLENLVKNAVGFDATRGDTVAIAARPFVEIAPAESIAFYDKPWFMALLRQGGAILAALLAFLFVGRPILKAMRKKGAQSSEERALQQQLLGVVPSRPAVTLDMIEAAPSYETRANLVRDFVKQDSAKAATVVRQLMGERVDG
ncbi:MAG: flagellar basal-body MS-ring/collar protein FliF [Sphingomonadales bacterium]